MQFGYEITGAKQVPIIGPRRKTLILRSPETLFRLFLDDVHAGRDVAFFGDVAHVLPFIPQSRIADTKLFHLSEERPLGLNPFGDRGVENATAILDAFKATWNSQAPTPQLDRYLLTGALAMSELPDGTLFYLHYLLTSPDHRARVMSRLKDKVLRGQWEDFHKLPLREQNSLTMSITNRLTPLVTDPTVRRMIAQTKTIDTSGVLIVDLPEGDRFNLLAALILSQTKGMAYIERPILHVGKSVPVISASHLGEIPDALLDNLLNTATILSARVGAVDAKVIEPHFNLKPDDYKPTTLPEGRALLRLETTHTIHLEPHNYRKRPANVRKVKAHTVQKYGTPKEVIDQKIDQFLDSAK